MKIDPTKIGLQVKATRKQIVDRLSFIATHHSVEPSEQDATRVEADTVGEAAPVLPEGAEPKPRPANFGRGIDHP